MCLGNAISAILVRDFLLEMKRFVLKGNIYLFKAPLEKIKKKKEK